MVNNTLARPANGVALPAPTIVGQATAVEQARAVAEVAAAVQVAQQNPRDMNRAWAEMRAACGRLSLASRAFYSVPNRGTGPSVHLARELARIWGNLDYGVHELHRDDAGGKSEVRAFAWDQQTNVRSSRTLQVPHARMRGRDRQPLVDLSDIYLNNQNVGARAVRESIFTVLPADFVAEAQDICRQTIEKGDGEPLDKRIAGMVAAFAGIGVKVAQIEAKLDRKRGQWTAADVADLGVVFSSIKRRDVNAEDEFPAAPVTGAEIAQANAAQPAPAAATVGGPVRTEVALDDNSAPALITTDQRERLSKLWAELGYAGDENLGNRRKIVKSVLKLADLPESTDDLTTDEAERVIEALEARKAKAPAK